ncbi:MAG: hypothetical protein ABI883_01870, partial [Chthoniobacterales bacterium]
MIKRNLWTSLAVLLCLRGLVVGQDAATPNAATTPASSAEVEQLRQQVQALTEMVQTLQQQVKDQQASNAELPQNPEPSPLPGSSPTDSAAVANDAPAPLFPTTDTAVVAGPSNAAPPSAPTVDANGTAFPTSDEEVTSVTDTTAGGSALTQPIPIIGGGGGGGKTYMNISFDGQFALAGS